MKCPKCQFDNKEDATFCLECGNRLEFKCPLCERILPVSAKFCDKCGHVLKEPKEAPPIDYNHPQSYTPKFLADKILTTRSSIEGERKLVTVLFADVANYTSIAEKLDPEEVHQIMDGCFKILMDEIHRYEGTINQFTGDGVMALFGAPVAHEDHAQRTCYAALSVQKAMGEYSEKLKKAHGIDFRMRIGLNSGHVVVGSIGDDLRMDYTAVGDTTNLASRMQSMAKAGHIVVSRNTYKLTRGFFEFGSLGKVQVKGKEEPQESYELIKASAVETRIEAAVAKGLTKFVGRQREMEALKEAFVKAQSGSGQVVGIVGEAGVGKSRLKLELRNMLPTGQYTYLEGRCLHFGGSMAYLPILDILRSYLEIKEEDRELAIKKRLEEKVLALDKKLKGVLPSFHELLSLKVEEEAYLQLDPQQKRQSAFEAIRGLLVRVSQKQPLAVAVEDLHWIDKTSEEFLDYLIGGLPNTHILLIFLYRPEYTHQWGSKSYYSKIGVDQLSTRRSVELVQSILEEGEVVPELTQLILTRAGGNPLFVEELTHSLLENGSIQTKNHQYVLSRKASEIQVPDTIQGIIAARIDRVEERLKRIMQVASVIGREFAYGLLQSITGMQEELKSYLLKLQELEFIYEKRLFPELEYIFKHALMQEVAYGSLLLKRRREIHEKIGKAIESLYFERLEEYYELLAYHYVRSANTEKAVEYVSLANQKAVKVSAMEDAKAYFDEAMKLLDTLPETEVNRQRRISLFVNSSIVFQMLFKFPEYYELLTHHKPLAARIDNPWLQGAFNARLGQCEFWLGHFDKAIQTETKAAELCESAGNAEDAGYAYMMCQWSHLFRADYDRVFALREKALHKMEHRFNLRWYVWARTGVSWAWFYVGRWNEAVEEAENTLSVAEEYSDKSMISFANWTISWAYTAKGDLNKALEYAELGVQKAPTQADKAWAQGALAWAWCRAGELKKGIEVLESLVPIYRAGRFMPSQIFNALMLGEGYWLAGDYHKAKQTLEDVLEVAEKRGARFYIGSAHRILGEVALKTNPAQATPHFDKSIAVLREIKAENELALAYAGYGKLHKQQGNIEQAREYLTEALVIFERLGTLIEPDKVTEALTDLPAG